MTYQTFTHELDEGLARITLNRPDALNALNTVFFREMNAFLDSHPPVEAFRVLVITGSGKAFAAGADIAEMVDKDKQEAMAYSRLGQETFARLEALEVPVIAAVNGYALGGGLELALACDFRIASSKAVFGQPEVNLGLIPGFAATKRLPLAIGLPDALYYLLTAENISAEEALRLRMVQKVVPPDELMEHTLSLARKILSKGPAASRLVKQVVRKGQFLNMEKASLHEQHAFSSLFGNEGTEGLRAFLEKRTPNWNQ